MPIEPIGGPPPPKVSFGHGNPPPRPPHPRLMAVQVRPHLLAPFRNWDQVWFTAWQIWLSTFCSRVPGFSRLVTTLRPVPLKKLLRQESVLTLAGRWMVWLSAAMRAVVPLAAACTIAVQ